MDLCAGRPAVLLQPQPPPPPFFSFFLHVQLSPCSSPRLAEISDCGEKPNSGLESHSSPIWCHPPTPKAKYGSNLPRGSSIDLGPFKQLEATLDSADCPSLLLKLERERKLKRSFVTKMRELAKKVCRVLEVLSPLC